MTDTNMFRIRHGAEPFLLDGGEVGCVCLHGFTASPEEMRWLGEYLNARGLTIYAPRLSGHGTDPAHMRRQHWLNWYEDALSAVALLRGRCRKVFIAGLSMGGLLSLRAAAAGVVDGAVVMAAPVYLDIALLRFAPLIQFIRPYYTGRNDNPGEDLDTRVRVIQREQGREAYGRMAYDIKPTRSVGQLHRLMNEVRRHLPEVTAPLLLIYSRGDRTVPFGNLEVIANAVRSSDLVTRTLDHSDHCLTQEIERETVFEMVWDFLAARLD
jgi:carboxylesterase